MNVININVKETVVPFNIGGLEFSVEISDENLEFFQNKHEDLLSKTENLEGSMEVAKELQKEAFDAYLGEGAYDKLYAKFPSTLVLADVLTQVMIAFGERLDSYTGSNNDIQKRYDEIVAKKKAKKK